MKSRKSCDLAFCALLIAAITFSLTVRSQAQTETVLFTFTGPSSGQYHIGGGILCPRGRIHFRCAS